MVECETNEQNKTKRKKKHKSRLKDKACVKKQHQEMCLCVTESQTGRESAQLRILNQF